MNKVKALFVCGHNAARCQIAKAFMNHLSVKMTPKSAKKEKE